MRSPWRWPAIVHRATHSRLKELPTSRQRVSRFGAFVLVTCSYVGGRAGGRPATSEELCDMEFQNGGKGRTNIKLFSALIGGSAVVAMAALGVAVGQQSAGDAVAKSSLMTVGSTSTQTTPSAAPATGVAKPTIKSPAPLPSEEEAAK